MFEDLFIDPGTIARYRSAPLLEERLSYLEHCAHKGARRRTLREVAAHQTRLVHLLDLREAPRVSMRRIEAVAMHWSRPDGCRSHRAARPGARQRFVGHARCLEVVERFFDGLNERNVPLASVRITDIDQAVTRWQAGGCSRTTIHCYAQRLRTVQRQSR